MSQICLLLQQVHPAPEAWGPFPSRVLKGPRSILCLLMRYHWCLCAGGFPRVYTRAFLSPPAFCTSLHAPLKQAPLKGLLALLPKPKPRPTPGHACAEFSVGLNVVTSCQTPALSSLGRLWPPPWASSATSLILSSVFVDVPVRTPGPGPHLLLSSNCICFRADVSRGCHFSAERLCYFTSGFVFEA